MNMFVGFSKVIGKSKFRVGAGMRLTKQNVWYMLFVLLIYWMFLLCFYVIAFSLWIVYAFCYGVYWCIKKVIQKLKS